KDLLPVGMVLFFAVALWMLVLLMTTAGHRVGTEGITAGWLDRIPMDLMFVIAFVLECIPVAVIGIVVDGMDNRQHPVFTIIVVAIAAFVFCLIGLRWLMTVAVNVKLGHWWQNTLIYKLCHVIGAWWGRTRLDIRAIRRTIRWDIRIWIIFGAFVLFELFGLIVFDARGDLVLVWFCEKVLFGFLLFQILKHYAKLKNSVVQMAEGDMNVQIDTKGMPLDFEEHGEALNKISSGMTTAVTERIKSERMKTELITNVSHDIKTPLTSIINYVDLLQKEQINNETAKGYLEVLDRQAKRLKKLIEDLIEASKAATGNIKFHMESVNANTLLNQSIGEFEEKLEANQITLVTNMPEEEIHLWADNRYLWRVFDNIMNNIAKYAQPGTRAYVDLKDSNDKVTFTFRNTSKNELNISADELMERFVRGDASRNTEGNGLGLSIARSLTESMDGTMNLAIDGDLFKVILEFRKQ
ncbi:MAG: HAMP domain-containing histidine kinase, partial [Lachnospiraceae bacterium]|nr:HAMP domain-containing histidine kinase [Lachnospiraceae bacterium]